MTIIILVLILFIGGLLFLLNSVLNRVKSLQDRIQFLREETQNMRKDLSLSRHQLNINLEREAEKIYKFMKFLKDYPFHFSIEEVQNPDFMKGGRLIKSYGCRWDGGEKGSPVFMNEGIISEDFLLHAVGAEEYVERFTRQVVTEMVGAMLENDLK